MIGIGVPYYGGCSPDHRASILACERAGMAIVWLSGGAYPEMNYAEIARDALAHELELLVFVRQDAVFTVQEVEMAAAVAKSGAIVTGSSEPSSLLAFTAVPLSALVAMAAQEERTYSNTAVLDTGFSNEKSRPFASPWAPLANHSVEVNPLKPGHYITPEQAFIERAVRAGVAVTSLWHVGLNIPKASTRIYKGDPERRARHGITTNYAFCVPTFGALDHVQQDALWQLEKAGCAIVEYRNCPYIDQARSELTRIALEELSCDGVFFIDHDIIFIPADALKMIDEAERLQDVVSAPYCMRKTAHAIIGAIAVPIGTDVGFFDDGKLYPAIYSGLGFSAIPKAVFEALDKQLPLLHSSFTGSKLRPYFALDVNGTFYSGEDASFCARVQGLTIKMVPGSANPNGHDWDVQASPERALTTHKVWLDTRVRIFHRGSYDYGIEDHSIAVPRYAHLTAKLAATRGELRIIQADNLSAQAQAAAQGATPSFYGATPVPVAPHSVLEERGPCLNCSRSFTEHELVQGTERMGWVRLCQEVGYDHQYVELLHAEHAKEAS